MRVKLDSGAFIPCHAHPTDAGYDLRCKEGFVIPSGESVSVETGLHLRIPAGFVGIVKSKSGLNFNHNVVVDGDGVIDAGYIGAVKVKLRNNGKEDFFFNRGDKIAQIIFLACWTPNLKEVDELEDTDRGENGFGSSGR